MGKGPLELEGCPCIFAQGPPSSKLRHWSKPQVCRRNCSDICHTVGDTTTSGLDGYIVISRCPSLSRSLGDTIFELAMVENPGLVAGISTLSVVVPAV